MDSGPLSLYSAQSWALWRAHLLGVRSFSSVLGLSLRFRVTGVNKGQEAAKAAYSKRSNKYKESALSLKSQDAKDIKRLTGSEHGVDVSAVLNGKCILVESKGETPNDPNKQHEFSGAQFDSHISRQVFSALKLRKSYPDATVYIANPMNSKIISRFEKVDLRPNRILALWVDSDMHVKTEPGIESSKPYQTAASPTEDTSMNASMLISDSATSRTAYSSESLPGYKFGVALAVLFPSHQITQNMIRNCTTISGSFPEAAEVHKALTNRGGSQRARNWIGNHGGKSQLLSEMNNLLKEQESLARKIKGEIRRQFGVNP